MVAAAMLVLLCVGCASPPPYAGEWVLEGSDDGRGNFTPAPANEISAFRFDPPATVAIARYDPASRKLVEGTLNKTAYAVFDAKMDVIQFAAFGARVVDGELQVGYPGQGFLRMRRWSGPRLFPAIPPIDLQRWLAEQKAMDAADDAANDKG
jgi:hypothetical protein